MFKILFFYVWANVIIIISLSTEISFSIFISPLMLPPSFSVMTFVIFAYICPYVVLDDQKEREKKWHLSHLGYFY